MEKLILLTVLGFENSGKSTLLNSLLGGRLAYCNYNVCKNCTFLCDHMHTRIKSTLVHGYHMDLIYSQLH